MASLLEGGKQRIPSCRGIYVFCEGDMRKDAHSARCLYVGKATGANGVQDRVWKHIHGKGNHPLWEAIHAEGGKDRILCAWMPSLIGDWREADLMRRLPALPPCNERFELTPIERHARTPLGWMCHGLLMPCRFLVNRRRRNLNKRRATVIVENPPTSP